MAGKKVSAKAKRQVVSRTKRTKRGKVVESDPSDSEGEEEEEEEDETDKWDDRGYGDEEDQDEGGAEGFGPGAPPLLHTGQLLPKPLYESGVIRMGKLYQRAERKVKDKVADGDAHIQGVFLQNS